MDVASDASKIAAQVLNTHGILDDRVDVLDAVSFSNIIPTSTLHLLHGCGHDYNERKGCQEELYGVLKEWLISGAAQRLSRVQAVSSRL